MDKCPGSLEEKDAKPGKAKLDACPLNNTKDCSRPFCSLSTTHPTPTKEKKKKNKDKAKKFGWRGKRTLSITHCIIFGQAATFQLAWL